MGQERSKLAILDLIILMLISFEIGSGKQLDEERMTKIVNQLKLVQLYDPCDSDANCTDTLIPTMICINRFCECDSFKTKTPIDLNGYHTCGMKLREVCFSYSRLPQQRSVVIDSLHRSGMGETEIKAHLDRYDRFMTSMEVFPAEKYSPLDLSCESKKCGSDLRCAVNQGSNGGQGRHALSQLLLLSYTISLTFLN